MPIQPIGNTHLANIAGAIPAQKDPPQKTETTAPEIKSENTAPQNNAVDLLKKDVALDQKSLTEALRKLNEFVGSASNDLVFAQDKETGIEIIKVIDTKTKEVIRQLPSEEVIQIAKTLDKLQGLLVRDQV